MRRNQKKRTSERNTQSNPSRRTLLLLFIFVGMVLLANAVIGERGLMATRSARAQAEQLESDIDYLRSDNQKLREMALRLRSDATAIEEAARRDLGLLRQGEIVIIIRDGRGIKSNADTPGGP